MGRNVFHELYRPNRRDLIDLSHLPPELRDIYRRNTARLLGGVQHTRTLDFDVSNVYHCSCCGKRQIDLSIAQKVSITPDGANSELPPVGEVELTDAALTVAIGIFDDVMLGYETLLIADVINMAATDILETLTGSDWVWNQETKRYRNTETGETLTENKQNQLRDTLVDLWMERVRLMAEWLASGELTIQEWTLGMRREITNVFADEYMMAKGGWNAMYQEDVNTLADLIFQQFGYLQDFAEVVKQGELSKAQIGARSELYTESATQSFERGRARRHGIILPAYPADGSQICQSRCRCRWSVKETEERVDAFWQLDPQAVHCDTCLANAEAWNPYWLPLQ